MDNNTCVILGCGESINKLSPNEKEFINKQSVIIAMNKFMAYYHQTGLIPTHVYFTDIFSEASRRYLDKIFRIIERDDLSITLILNKRAKYQSTRNKTIHRLLKVIYFVPNLFFNRFRTLLLLPKKSKIEFISYQPWDNPNNKWETNINKKLFHYRGSLSTVFNFVSIKWPNRLITLAGVDFTNNKYFFEADLKKESFETTDWTTAITQKEKVHFSLVPLNGSRTLFDLFPYILKKLKESNNSVVSINPNSRLVTEKLVKYFPIES